MKYVDFFGNKVSKLIVGDNPFNGHSYIHEYITGKEMVNYHTEDKILEAMHRMEELGINTMLPLADPYIIRILQHYRNNGGKMNFIFQHYAPVPIENSIPQMMTVDPIGAYISGSFIDVNYELGKKDEILKMIDKAKETVAARGGNMKIGIGTHHPEVVEISEEEDWGADFYMACMYNLRRNRIGEQSGFLTGKTKAGIVAIPEDRPVMLETLKKIKKPVLAFKIFAGGQMLVDRTEAERRVLIEDAYNTIFTALKEDDLAVMGIFQKYHDQLGENVSVFEEWAAKQK